MTKSRSNTRRELRSLLLPGLMALLLELLLPVRAVFTHPLDVYLQASYITLAPAQVVVELDLSPGVLVVPQILPQMDTDGDQKISEVEGQVYADSVLQNIVLQVDGQPLTLAVTKIDMPDYLTIQAGYGTIRVYTVARLADGMTGTHQIYYNNNYTPTGSAYQVNAFVDKNIAITLGKQNRDDIQQSMQMDYAIGSAEPILATSMAKEVANSPAETKETAISASLMGTPMGSSAQARQLMSYLYEPALSPWALMIALGLAVALGGLHALTPGHGKTLVAAYLVGSRGTVRHAVLLGAIVTFTHTSSVILIGLLALFASQFVVPDVLVPILEICSGLLVVFLGTRLIWQRWIAIHNGRKFDVGYANIHNQNHNYIYRQSHDHVADHTQLDVHDHGDGHKHSHLPSTQGLKLGSLAAMGVSGGLLPCPEALGIMIIAIGLNRILLGMGLIVSFSFGLAAVLIVIGILLVRSRSLVERFGGNQNRWSMVLPLVSAVIVTVLGIGITLSGLATYLR